MVERNLAKVDVTGSNPVSRLEFPLIYCWEIHPEASAEAHTSASYKAGCCEINYRAVWTKADGEIIYERLREGVE